MYGGVGGVEPRGFPLSRFNRAGSQDAIVAGPARFAAGSTGRPQSTERTAPDGDRFPLRDPAWPALRPAFPLYDTVPRARLNRFPTQSDTE